MIKICYIPNKKRFVELIRGCMGEVRLHFADGTSESLNKNAALLQMLGTMEVGGSGLDFSFSEPKDTATVFQYLMEAAHDEALC